MRKPAESTMKDTPLRHRLDVHSAEFPCVGKYTVNSPALPNSVGEISVLLDTEG